MLKLKRSFEWIALFGSALFILESTAYTAGKRVKATITNIVDGDTAHAITEDGKKHKVRYLGMDSPELHFQNESQGTWGQQATDHLHLLMNAKPAKVAKGGRLIGNAVDRTTGKGIQGEIEIDGVDTYKRALGYIYVNGVNTNLQMVKDGWAVPYLYCTHNICNKSWEAAAHAKDYVEACKSAEKQELGIFDPAKPLDETPDEFRRRLDGRPAYQYIGDFETKKLYKPADGGEVDWCLRIRFETEADALAIGYSY